MSLLFVVFSGLLFISSIAGCQKTKKSNSDTQTILEIYNSDYKMHSDNEKELVRQLSSVLSPNDLKLAIIRIENEKISTIQAFDKITLTQYNLNLKSLNAEIQTKVKTDFDMTLSNLMEGPISDQQIRERIVSALIFWRSGKTAQECLSHAGA